MRLVYQRSHKSDIRREYMCRKGETCHRKTLAWNDFCVVLEISSDTCIGLQPTHFIFYCIIIYQYVLFAYASK